MYLDAIQKKRQTESQLRRRGLMKPEIDLKKIGVLPLIDVKPVYDRNIYTVVDNGNKQDEDGNWYIDYSLKLRPAEEVDWYRQLQVKALLSATDPWGLADRDDIDSRVIKWRTYRSQLRALNDSDNWYLDTVWPTPPDVEALRTDFERTIKTYGNKPEFPYQGVTNDQ